MNKNHIQFSLMILLALFVPVFYLFFFAHPVADDLVSKFQLATEGFIPIVKKTYNTWNGRYSGNIFNYLFAQFESVTSYRLILISCLLFFMFSFYTFVQAILPRIKFSERAIITLMGVLTTISILPTSSEGLYWYTGVIYYQLGLSFSLLLVALVIHSLSGCCVINKSIHQILTILVLLTSVGMNETLAAVNTFVLFIILVHTIKLKLASKKTVLIYFIVSLIGLAFVYLAPGNENRITAYSNNKQLINALFMTGLQSVRFMGSFIISFTGLFYFLLIAKYHDKLNPTLPNFKPHMVILGIVLITIICVFLPYYATGTLGQHRTLNVAAIFYVVGLSLLGLKVGKELDKRLPRRNWRMVVFFAMLFFVLGNGRIFFANIQTGDAEQYSDEMTKRTELIKAFQNTKDVPLLTKKPESIFVIDIKQDTNYWVDKAYLLNP